MCTRWAGDQFGQIIPKDNDMFVGAPGAILDGQGVNHTAFRQHATGVTIKYLEIRQFRVDRATRVW